LILAAYQNENAGCYGKDRQDNRQAAHRDKCGQARKNEPDGQQQETNIFSDVHENLLSLSVKTNGGLLSRQRFVIPLSFPTRLSRIFSLDLAIQANDY